MEIFLSKTGLFRGLTPDEIRTVLPCLNVERRWYERGEMIYCAGEKITSMGLVLSGSVQIENDDLWGNKSILDRVMPGFVFAETYAFQSEEPLLVNVLALEKTEVLFVHVRKLCAPCANRCVQHDTLTRNLLMIATQKNLQLSRRIFYTSSKTIRGRVLSYLSDQAVRQESTEITIPFNRQQLADYLSVDRSALSNELSKMQRDGLLTAHKNHVSLNQPML